jgi:hypothetical protein
MRHTACHGNRVRTVPAVALRPLDHEVPAVATADGMTEITSLMFACTTFISQARTGLRARLACGELVVVVLRAGWRKCSVREG